MAYATLAELREYLPQANSDGTQTAALLAVLERATSIIDGYLGFSYAAYGAASTKLVTNYGTPDLTLPPHQAGSVTAISFDGAALTDYQAITDARGVETLIATSTSGWGTTAAPLWTRGRYLVTAVWGYGPAPERVKEVCLELAVNIWAAKEAARFSDVVGVEGGGAVGYARALTNQQRMILDGEKARYWQFTV